MSAPNPAQLAPQLDALYLAAIRRHYQPLAQEAAAANWS